MAKSQSRMCLHRAHSELGERSRWELCTAMALFLRGKLITNHHRSLCVWLALTSPESLQVTYGSFLWQCASWWGDLAAALLDEIKAILRLVRTALIGKWRDQTWTASSVAWWEVVTGHCGMDWSDYRQCRFGVVMFACNWTKSIPHSMPLLDQTHTHTETLSLGLTSARTSGFCEFCLRQWPFDLWSTISKFSNLLLCFTPLALFLSRARLLSTSAIMAICVFVNQILEF